MLVEVKVPPLPESVSDATVLTWHKKAGDAVARDEQLVDLETDKVVLEVLAPTAGVLSEIHVAAGTTVKAQDLLASVQAGASTQAPSVSAATVSAPAVAAAQPSLAVATADSEPGWSPAARRLLQERALEPSHVVGSGRHGRVTYGDVLNHLADVPTRAQGSGSTAAGVQHSGTERRPEQRVPMTRLRSRIAERLVSAKRNAAILTTVNEINLKAVMDLRHKYKDLFEKQHGVKLGFMSLFTKAVVEALKRFPAVNASIEGTDVIYHGYYDIGIAVSTERGLVVPIVRDAQDLSLAGLEKTIGDFAQRARHNQITLDDMSGGTFTITNGGVFGSLLATPILNPPQTGILGMHKIEERPVAENGLVVIRPMMYVALSYDHRLIDGRDSVQFLVTIKDFLEDPVRLLLEI